MRTLLATDAFFPKIDGVAETTGFISRMLSRRGHDVTILAPCPGNADHNGVPVVRLKALPLPFYKDVRVSYSHRRLAQAIQSFKPEATIVLTPGTIGLDTTHELPRTAPIVTIYTTDIPRYLSTYHLGALRNPAERVMRWMSSRSMATLCPTEVVRKDLESRSFPRLDVWGRGVDRELFNPGRRSDAMRFRLSGGETHKPLVLYVGRLAREKRLGDLLAAAHQLRDVRFALVGDGPDRDSLMRQFSEVPTVFTGFLRGPELAEAFASADVFAFPSDTETFGQVVLQAMASGVPPVVPRGSAPAEFVEDGATGLHFQAQTPSQLAAAIRRLVDRPAERQEMGKRAAECARRHSWESLIDRLECLISSTPTLRSSDVN